jgi:hypothetical protein
MLERGFINDDLRALDGIDSDMLLRWAGDDVVVAAFRAVGLSPSVLPSLKLRLCTEGVCDAGGVGYGFKPSECDFSGARGDSLDSFDLE